MGEWEMEASGRQRNWYLPLDDDVDLMVFHKHLFQKSLFVLPWVEYQTFRWSYNSLISWYGGFVKLSAPNIWINLLTWPGKGNWVVRKRPTVDSIVLSQFWWMNPPPSSGVLRKYATRVLYVAMDENHFWVAKSGFWGEFWGIFMGGIQIFKSCLRFSFRWSEAPFPRYGDSRVFA